MKGKRVFGGVARLTISSAHQHHASCIHVHAHIFLFTGMFAGPCVSEYKNLSTFADHV
jgi:hypothetical protein